MLTCTTYRGPTKEIYTLGLMRISNTSEPMDMETHENHYELLFLHTGEKTLYMDGRVYTMHGGDVLLIPPGQTHGNPTELQSRTSLTYLLFNDPSLQEDYLHLSDSDRNYLISRLQKMRMTQITPAAKRILRDLTEQIQKEGGVLHAARVSALFLLLLDSVTESLPQSADDVPADIRRVLDYIEDTPSDLPDTAQLAAIAGLSETHFKQKFRQYVGLPPAEYTARRHVEWVAERLCTDEMSVAQIAEEFGFSSAQHLTRLFKRHRGVTPSEFRRSGGDIQ